MGKNKKNKKRKNNNAIKSNETAKKVVATVEEETTETPVEEVAIKKVSTDTSNSDGKGKNAKPKGFSFKKTLDSSEDVEDKTAKKVVATVEEKTTETPVEEVAIKKVSTDTSNSDGKGKNAKPKGFSFKKIFSSITKTLDEKPDSNGDKKDIENASVADELTPACEEEKPLLKVDNPFKRFFAKNTLTTISTALDEDVDEISSLSGDKSGSEEVATPSKKRIYNRRIYYFIGLSFTVMSIVGLIFTITFCVNIVKRFTDNTAQKEKFARYLYPLVVTDLPPYDNVEQLSDEHIITAAIWDLIMYGDLDKYVNNFDVITVPTIDVERHATKLFGDKITFNHKTFMASSINFYYDDEMKSYNIPISPTYYSYIPEIEDIEKDGKQFTLLVAYKRDTPSWLAVREEKDNNVSKYIEFIVLQEDNSYKILSMENVSSEYNINAN